MIMENFLFGLLFGFVVGYITVLFLTKLID